MEAAPASGFSAERGCAISEAAAEEMVEETGAEEVSGACTAAFPQAVKVAAAASAIKMLAVYFIIIFPQFI
ncbi:hypothetical protein ANACOL_04239 [Anaerotruncus colihominis DSM 17241]|uniref:Uncharacterized protein n=1 Tax=Anaerotruncus colihominis DSM 17241 TaxID=445972 RepID=B0PHE5_9FIRM|nr:hypothetical protein ANACOL_04239 [Anaerotruncus colihominis DSM 17241]